MIANFFQTLSDHRVEYFLISGQATVLYGAATFSEDIDLWINPIPHNRTQFVAALRACRARYYKLTPPFELEHLIRGHGFHFTLPENEGTDVFLDVMGKPPRTDSFDSTKRTSRWMNTDWGRVRVVGLKDLVELKKTQRLEDYPIISRLALAWLEQPECAGAAADYQWVMDNIFTLTDARLLLTHYPKAINCLPATVAPWQEFARALPAGDDVPDEVEARLNAWMQERIQRLQQADRHYWRDIIRELRQFRATGNLMHTGAEV